MTDVERFDAVVVGSGFGGAVAAARLAGAGLSVVVLERGQPYAPGAFARTPRHLRASFWDPPAGLHGMYDVWSFDHSAALVASGLGGGSLIYSNVMLRKSADTFVRENLRDGGDESWPVTRADLDRHYDEVQRVQRPRRYPVAQEPYASTPRAVELREAAERLDLPVEHPPLAVTFAADDGPPAPGRPIAGSEDNVHGRPRLTCRLCGECNIGCNDGAKNTLDFTYLSDAWRAGARLRCCCEARSVRWRDGGYEVGYRQHLAARGGHPAHLLDPVVDEADRRVHGRLLVLAAGTFGSTRLLLANRAALPGLSPALGTRYSSNGDVLMFVRNCRRAAEDGRAAADDENGRRWRHLDPSRGPVITTAVHVDDEQSPSGREHWVQDAGAPAFTEWMWQMLELPEDMWALRRTAWRRLRERLSRRRD
ncbi:MAG: GMC family oxidoreductase, partial [Solirubrobacterales bacterium]|nr:GMC family oxidoreductase [Solirubrobacterales bacterium]